MIIDKFVEYDGLSLYGTSSDMANLFHISNVLYIHWVHKIPVMMILIAFLTLLESLLMRHCSVI